jgi:hypothetical protein
MLDGKVNASANFILKGVNLKEFGAFTFEVVSDTVKPAQLSNFDVSKDLNA